jgi:hypothetical protein
MRNRAVDATFRLPVALHAARVEVLGEDRSLTVRDAQFADAFDAYAVHLYRLAEVP